MWQSFGRHFSAQYTVYELDREVSKLRLEQNGVSFVGTFGQVNGIDFLKLS